MAYVAWDKVSTPKGMGGLGLRKLEDVNKALVLKTLWKMAQGSDAQWIKAMEAKYFPRGALWSTKRASSCSKLWKQLMTLRPLLAIHVVWKIGSGANIPIYSQP